MTELLDRSEAPQLGGSSAGGCDMNRRGDGILLELVDHLDAMVAYWDNTQTCVFANNAYLDWFGKTREQMIGIKLEQLLGPIYQRNLPYLMAAYAGQRQVFEREIPTPDGRLRYSLATYTPRIVEGRVEGIFVHVADVTPLKLMERELREAKVRAEELATHDFLTGTLNRVLLKDRIQQAMALSKRTRRFVAAISLDLDAFKLVNDTYGHGAGDQLLVTVANRLTSSVREFDSVTRMGGDEFFVLIPEVDSKAQVEAMAERLLQRVTSPVEIEGAALTPACCMGIALHPPLGVTPEGLIGSSDRALLEAKKLGPNRYLFATRPRR